MLWFTDDSKYLHIEFFNVYWQNCYRNVNRKRNKRFENVQLELHILNRHIVFGFVFFSLLELNSIQAVARTQSAAQISRIATKLDLSFQHFTFDKIIWLWVKKNSNQENIFHSQAHCLAWRYKKKFRTNWRYDRL